jgi:hypothetical protein
MRRDTVACLGLNAEAMKRRAMTVLAMAGGASMRGLQRTRFRIGKIRWMAVWIFAAAFATGLAHADQTSTILNRAFAGSTGTGNDLEVRIVSVDSVALTEEKPQVQVNAGARALEVLCTTRVFGGMGRADLEFKTTVTVNLEAGRVYQLDAQVMEHGDCTPQLNVQ